jgi:hypothetical protein
MDMRKNTRLSLRGREDLVRQIAVGVDAEVGFGNRALMPSSRICLETEPDRPIVKLEVGGAFDSCGHRKSGEI